MPFVLPGKAGQQIHKQERIIMEGLPLSVQELSHELSAFGVDQILIQALKGRQLLCQYPHFATYLTLY